MFRHTEIQNLLRERRRLEDLDSPTAEEHNGTASGSAIAPDLLPDAAGLSRTASARSPSDEPDDEAEYARFLAAERREFEKSAAQKRTRGRHDVRADDRTISTRRKVRELDEVASADQVLDYGDGPSMETTKPAEPCLPAEQVREGRRIWWPVIGGA